MDAVLRELDPSYRADTLPPKRLRRIKLFGSGELNRLIADALRRAEKPLRAMILPTPLSKPRATGGSPHALTRRVRRVVKTGDRLRARWSLPAA
jgi:hypothetical protein